MPIHIDDPEGGPAYPVPIGTTHYAGLSQRQYFAGQALVGLLLGKSRDTGVKLATQAFAIADLFLAEGRKS